MTHYDAADVFGNLQRFVKHPFGVGHGNQSEIEEIQPQMIDGARPRLRRKVDGTGPEATSRRDQSRYNRGGPNQYRKSSCHSFLSVIGPWSPKPGALSRRVYAQGRAEVKRARYGV